MDEFSHEQCLIVKCEGKEVLFSGCAHNFTGHCTGEEAFRIMKEILGEQIVYVRCGEQIVL